MEAGTAATAYRPQRESDVLVQCQRYFEKSYNLGTARALLRGWAATRQDCKPGIS